ncbi:MAG: alcohol dehydrogenase [Rhizobiaceae bacterium]|nr:MAG: alcohol dehydrogenase [Rhizobiaceae bacterium]
MLGKSLTLKVYLYNEIISDDILLQRAKDFISEGLRSGQLKSIVSKVFKLDDIQEAHRYLESNEQIGKIIVNV